MKILILLIVCASVVHGCVFDFKNKEKIERYAEECIDELDLDPSEIYEYMLADTTTCFKDCFQKKLGILKKDGTFNKQNLVLCGKTPEEKKRLEYLTGAMELACKSEAEKNSCKKSACYYVYVFMQGQYP